MQLTVIIPTRNRPHLLQQAVGSVLRQAGVELELIIVDDGEQPLPSFADPRVRSLTSTIHGGVHARQLGIDSARGTYIAFLDDDDWWTDGGFLSAALDAFNGGADFVFGDGEMIYEDGRPKQIFARDADVQSLASDNTILISSVVYRRDLHAALGAFDASIPYYWDWDWYLRVARAGFRLQRIARPVVAIRIHGENMSGPAQTALRQRDLDGLSTKHGLGKLVLKAHVDFAQPAA